VELNNRQLALVVHGDGGYLIEWDGPGLFESAGKLERVHANTFPAADSRLEMRWIAAILL
jgi:hypothetical protein